MDNLTKEQKLAMIDSRLTQWTQALYGHTVDMRVFEQAGFRELKAQATTNAQRSQIVIDELEKERAAVTDS